MTSDEPPTRRALAALAGLGPDDSTPGVADADDDPDDENRERTALGNAGRGGIDDGPDSRTSEIGPTGDDPAVPTDPVAAGAAAVRRGDTRALVTAAAAATDDVGDAAAFAAAGGFAHLAGAVAATGTDDPRTAARGATVLVTLAAFRRAARSERECGENADGMRTTNTDETHATDTDDTGTANTAEPGVDDGSGMCVEPVRGDE